MKKVAVIMGSASDLPVVEKAIRTLEEYGAPYAVHVFSAHRTPDEAAQFASTARAEGFDAAFARAAEWIDRCDTVIDAGVRAAGTNARMAELIELARSRGKLSS